MNPGTQLHHWGSSSYQTASLPTQAESIFLTFHQDDLIADRSFPDVFIKTLLVQDSLIYLKNILIVLSLSTTRISFSSIWLVFRFDIRVH